MALTLVMQSTGMAALVLWARAHLANQIHRFGLVRAAVLVVRFTSLIVCLHMSEMCLWASFFRWKVFSILGFRFLLFGNKLLNSRLWRPHSPADLAGGGGRSRVSPAC